MFLEESDIQKREVIMYDKFLDKQVVVDVLGNFIYLGILSRIEDSWIELSDVDVHDMLASSSTKEEYVINARVTGIIANRKNVSIDRDKIISTSLFSDIILRN